jgi:DNA-binding MarR family transcriptional regulator/DNA-binding CsgD family transcriptional regulator
VPAGPRREATTLESTGLAPSEALAYRTLLRSPTVSAVDLARRLGMTVVEAGLALRGLEAKGLVGRVPGTVHRFRVAPPEEAFRPIVRRRRAELRAMRADIGTLTDEYRAGPRAAERVEMLPGDPHELAAKLVAQAAVEVCALVPEGADLSGESPPAGVSVRMVVPRAVLARPEVRGYAEGMPGHLRAVDRPPLALLVVDRLVALLPVGATPMSAAQGGALLVHAGGLLDALVDVFDRTWATADPTAAPEPAEFATRGGGDEPTAAMPCPEDLRLLELMLDGYTDEAIAGRLDMGTRTVQRRVRDLIEAAGVRTRLQLIWHATRHGWI